MRTCKKNMREIWYSYFRGEEEIVNDDGNFTGVFKKLYTNPFQTKVNFAITKNIQTEQSFGGIENADLTIITDKNIFDLDTVVWTYKPDNLNVDESYEYKVFKIIKSINSYLIGLTRRIR